MRAINPQELPQRGQNIVNLSRFFTQNALYAVHGHENLMEF